MDLVGHLPNRIVFDINALPPEILVRILLWRFRARPEVWNVSGLQQVARVCRLWRDIVLSSPSLWSYISSPLKQPECSLQLRKSGNAPLIVDYTISVASAPQGLTGLQANAFRFLSIRCPPSDFVSLFGADPQWSPYLLLLDLSQPLNTMLSWAANSPMPELPIDTLPVTLRYLRIQHATLNWGSLRGPGLEILKIDNLMEGNGTVPRGEALHAALASCPKLRILELDNVGVETRRNNTTTRTPPRPGSLKLHCLRHLKLENVSNDILITLLPAIESPSLHSVTVRSFTVPHVDLPDLLRSLFYPDRGLVATACQRSSPPFLRIEFREDGIIADNRSQAELIAEMRGASESDMEPDLIRAPINVQLAMMSAGSNWINDFMNVVPLWSDSPSRETAVGLTLYEEVSLERSPLSTQLFVSFAEKFPLTVNIDIGLTNSMPSILWYLSRPTSTNDGRGEWLLPRLKRLRISTYLEERKKEQIMPKVEELIRARNRAAPQGCRSITVEDMYGVPFLDEMDVDLLVGF